MSVTAYVARAFCHQSTGGNPAGVVIVDQKSPFTPGQMQSIAKQLNFSETAFICPLKDRSYKVLFYTPSDPIDFCGHATLAAFGVLRQLNAVTDDTYLLETQAGPCEVTLKEHLIFLSQPLPVFAEYLQASEIAPVLDGSVSLDSTRPRIVSTGLRDIFVRVKDKDSLEAIVPNLKLMSDLNKKTNSIGVHVFSLNPTGSAVTADCRNFAPFVGIDEESATGSSNGALGCHLFEQGLLPDSSEHHLLFRQGENLKSPSDIYVHLKTDGKTVTKVSCGGEVVVDETRELQGWK